MEKIMKKLFAMAVFSAMIVVTAPAFAGSQSPAASISHGFIGSVPVQCHPYKGNWIGAPKNVCEEYIFGSGTTPDQVHKPKPAAV